LTFNSQYQQWWCGYCKVYPYIHPGVKIQQKPVQGPKVRDNRVREPEEDLPPLKLPLTPIDSRHEGKGTDKNVKPEIKRSRPEEEIRGPDGSVWFRVKNGKMRSTHQNPDSNYFSYDYELRGNNIYAKSGNPYESTGKPIYRVRGGRAERIEPSHREGDEHSSKFGIEKPKIKSARYESPFKKKRK
jgi:hypothetical protein